MRLLVTPTSSRHAQLSALCGIDSKGVESYLPLRLVHMLWTGSYGIDGDEWQSLTVYVCLLLATAVVVAAGPTVDLCKIGRRHATGVTTGAANF